MACDSTSSSVGGLNQLSTECILEKGECLAVSKDLLELRIFNVNPLPLVLPALDVGGACNEGNYPNNEITWQLTGNGVNHNSSASTQGKCVNGRFQLRIALPQGINVDQVYTLTLRLTGIDASGVSVENEFQAKKSISVSKPAS
jgi:hypothetical protein